MHFRTPFLAVVLAVLLLWGGTQGCNYSTDYFRIGPDGKKIKATGPITPDELAPPTTPEGAEGGDATGGRTGEDVPIVPTTEGSSGETSGGVSTGTTGGATTGGSTTGGGNTTGGSTTGTGGTGSVSLAPTTEINAYRRPDFSFVYVAIDRTTKKTELYLKSSAPNSVAKKLTNMNTEYEQDSHPAVSIDNQSVIFTHTSDWPNMYRITGLDQATPTVTQWAGNTGFGVSFFPDQDRVIFFTPSGRSLRASKYDGSGNVEEAAQDSGVYYGASASPTLEKPSVFYGKIILSFDLDDDGPTKPDLFLKELGNVYPFRFRPLATTPSVSETWPSISPDAKRLAFVRDGYLALCDLHQDEKTNPVCDNAFAFVGLTAENPCWTADGSRIVFSTKRDGNSEIYSVSATNASELENLTNSPGTDDVQPACFPNQVFTVIKENRAIADISPPRIPIEYYMPIKK